MFEYWHKNRKNWRNWVFKISHIFWYELQLLQVQWLRFCYNSQKKSSRQITVINSDSVGDAFIRAQNSVNIQAYTSPPKKKSFVFCLDWTLPRLRSAGNIPGRIFRPGETCRVLQWCGEDKVIVSKWNQWSCVSIAMTTTAFPPLTRLSVLVSGSVGLRPVTLPLFRRYMAAYLLPE